MPVPYFLDEMKPWEVEEALKNISHTQRGEWERARLLAYIMVQSKSREKLAPQDLLKFAWEHDSGDATPLTQEEIERLAAKAEKISKHITEGL